LASPASIVRGKSPELAHSENFIRPSHLPDPLKTFPASDIKFPVPAFRETGLKTEAMLGVQDREFRNHSQILRISL
jgi:hypothetical protein